MTFVRIKRYQLHRFQDLGHLSLFIVIIVFFNLNPSPYSNHLFTITGFLGITHPNSHSLSDFLPAIFLHSSILNHKRNRNKITEDRNNNPILFHLFLVVIPINFFPIHFRWRPSIIIIFQIEFGMGVCAGACSNASKGSQELVATEKKEILQQLKEAEQKLEQEQKNAPLEEVDQNKQQNLPSETEKPKEKENVEKAAKDEIKSTSSLRQKPLSTKSIPKVGGKGPNLIGKGKTEKDNELIASTLNIKNIVKLQKIELDNGITYEGEWFQGMRQGRGKQVWADGSQYQGEWKQNQANGQGTLYHSDGDVYEGQWAQDKANGHGKYTHSNGAKYTGEWKDDKQHGHGIEEWLDGEKYEGQYKNGTKTGNGMLKFLDGSYYKGEFLNNEIHGKGEYVWCENRRYEGDWQHNKMHGLGKIEWADGRKYEGEYQNDKKHGQGTFYWADGRKYIGGWINGKQHGKGQYYLQSGEKKIGQWVEGKRIKWIDESKKNKQNN